MKVIDLSATHFDADDDEYDAANTASDALPSLFSRIPFHREDPDGFNNDVFGWRDGGNGSFWVGLCCDDKTNDGLGCGGGAVNDTFAGKRVVQMSPLSSSSPPPIVFSNDIATRTAETDEAHLYHLHHNPLRNGTGGHKATDNTNTAEKERRGRMSEEEKKEETVLRVDTTFFSPLASIKEALMKAMAGEEGIGIGGGGGDCAVTSEEEEGCAKEHCADHHHHHHHHSANCPSANGSSCGDANRSSPSLPPFFFTRVVPSSSSSSSSISASSVSLSATSCCCQFVFGGTAVIVGCGAEEGEEGKAEDDTTTAKYLTRESTALSHSVQNLLRQYLSATASSGSPPAASPLYLCFPRSAVTVIKEAPHDGSVDCHCSHYRYYAIKGFVLGALNVPSCCLFDAPRPSSSLSTTSSPSSSSHHYSVYIAPLKIAVAATEQDETRKEEGRGEKFEEARDSSFSSSLCCSLPVPTRIILFEGATIGGVEQDSADAMATVPAAAAAAAAVVMDVTHTITADSPFFPGGQGLLRCPAAVAARKLEMQREAEAKNFCKRKNAAVNNCDVKNNSSSDTIHQPEAGGPSPSLAPSHPTNSTVVLIGCDVGTHIDSPQHFYANNGNPKGEDGDEGGIQIHKGITDLAAGGEVGRPFFDKRSSKTSDGANDDGNAATSSCSCCGDHTMCETEQPLKKKKTRSDLIAPLLIVDVRAACERDADYLITIEDVKRAAMTQYSSSCHHQCDSSSSTSSPNTTSLQPFSASLTDCIADHTVIGLTGWHAKFEESTAKKAPWIYQGKKQKKEGSSLDDKDQKTKTTGEGVAEEKEGNGLSEANYEEAMHFPGFAPETAEFLIDLNSNNSCGNNGSSDASRSKLSVAAIGIDTLSLDRGLSEDFMTHQIMLGKGNRYQVENLNLRRWVERCNASLSSSPSSSQLGWHAIVLPISVKGAFEANGRVAFVKLVPKVCACVRSACDTAKGS